MPYVTKAASFLWSNRRDGESEETAQPLPLSGANRLWGVADVPKCPGYPKAHVTVQWASCGTHCATLDCQFDTPGKEEPQLSNCLHLLA